MKIDLQITFDDLSEECKKKIKHLEDAGYKVNITYPRPYYYPTQEWAPLWPSQPIPLNDGQSQDPYEVKCCYEGIAR